MPIAFSSGTQRSYSFAAHVAENGDARRLRISKRQAGSGGAGSLGARSIWIRGSHFSQLGRYQFQRPRSFIAEGRITERMIVASISRAIATPKPICWKAIRSPFAKPEKTAT